MKLTRKHLRKMILKEFRMANPGVSKMKSRASIELIRALGKDVSKYDEGIYEQQRTSQAGHQGDMTGYVASLGVGVNVSPQRIGQMIQNVTNQINALSGKDDPSSQNEKKMLDAQLAELQHLRSKVSSQ
jgi:hypothetical protein|tara:strand:- start:1660 stop:2046 length:387 start_codon:yes stop_codon:yes gene_type:complete